MSSSLDRALKVAMSSKRPGKDYNHPSKKAKSTYYDIGMGQFPTKATLDIRDSGDSPTWNTNTTVSLPLMVRNYHMHEDYQKLWRQGTPMFVYKENKGILRKCADLPLMNQILRKEAAKREILLMDENKKKNYLLKEAKNWGFKGVLRSIMPGVRQMVVNVDCYGRSKLSCFLNDQYIRVGDVISLGYFWTDPAVYNVTGGHVEASSGQCIQILPIINYNLGITEQYPWENLSDKTKLMYYIPLGIVSNCGGRKPNYGKSDQACFVSEAMTLQKHIEILMC